MKLTTAEPIAKLIAISRYSGSALSIEGESEVPDPDDAPFFVAVATGPDAKRLREAFELMAEDADETDTVVFDGEE